MHKWLRRCTAAFGTLEMCSELDHSGHPRLKVPFLTVDEAGQATEPFTLVALEKVAVQGHVALVGDHMQLPPFVKSQSAREKGLERSMLERLHLDGGCKELLLAEQHRMHPQLWSWPNSTFYEDKVATGALAMQRRAAGGLPWREPLAFVHVTGWGRRVAVTCASPV